MTSYGSNTHDPQPQHSPMLNDGTYTAHNALPMCEVVSGESFGQTHANFSFQSPQRSTRSRNPQTAVTPQPPTPQPSTPGPSFFGADVNAYELRYQPSDAHRFCVAPIRRY